MKVALSSSILLLANLFLPTFCLPHAGNNFLATRDSLGSKDSPVEIRTLVRRGEKEDAELYRAQVRDRARQLGESAEAAMAAAGIEQTARWGSLTLADDDRFVAEVVAPSAERNFAEQGGWPAISPLPLGIPRVEEILPGEDKANAKRKRVAIRKEEERIALEAAIVGSERTLDVLLDQFRTAEYIVPVERSACIDDDDDDVVEGATVQTPTLCMPPPAVLERIHELLTHGRQLARQITATRISLKDAMENVRMSYGEGLSTVEI